MLQSVKGIIGTIIGVLRSVREVLGSLRRVVGSIRGYLSVRGVMVSARKCLRISEE